MVKEVVSSVLDGVEGHMIKVEVDIFNGLPYIDIVGQANSCIKESKDRIRRAISNSGYNFPKGRITINLSPASLQKSGSQLDAAIGIAILLASGTLKPKRENFAVLGELTLMGNLKKITGIIPMIINLKEEGIKEVIVPTGNKAEADLIDGIIIRYANSFKEIVMFLTRESETKQGESKSEQRENETKPPEGEDPKSYEKYFEPRDSEPISFYNEVKLRKNGKELMGKKMEDNCIRREYDYLDYGQIKGQEFGKQAMLISAAGHHSIILIGGPGSSKTMLTMRLPTIMPPLTVEEYRESVGIYSTLGMGDMRISYGNIPIIRKPHTGITEVGLIGGGIPMKAGEISLSHRGILFLDEMCLFRKNTLESLRVPLEQGYVQLIKNGKSYSMPSELLFVGATNPCPCGYYGDGSDRCKCSSYMIGKYRERISGPILDRIDIHINLPYNLIDEFHERNSLTSSEMRNMVIKAVEIQRKRFDALGHKKTHNGSIRGFYNGQLPDSLVDEVCAMEKEGEELLSESYTKLKLTHRDLIKTKKIARTIADLNEREKIGLGDVLAALQYRKRWEN